MLTDFLGETGMPTIPGYQGSIPHDHRLAVMSEARTPKRINFTALSHLYLASRGIGVQLHGIRISPHHVRFATLTELARASSLHQAQIDHLLTLPQHASMSRLANAVPAGMLCSVYCCLLEQLRLRKGQLGAHQFGVSENTDTEFHAVYNSMTETVLNADFLPLSVYRHSLELSTLSVEHHQSGLIDPT